MAIALAVASLQVTAAVTGLVPRDVSRDMIIAVLVAVGSAALLLLLLADDTKPG